MNSQVKIEEPKHEIGQLASIGVTAESSKPSVSSSSSLTLGTILKTSSTSITTSATPPTQNSLGLFTVQNKNGQVLFKQPVPTMNTNGPSLVTVSNNGSMIPKGHIIVRQKSMPSNNNQLQSSQQSSTTTLDMAALEKAGLKRPLTTPGGNMITKVIITKNPASGQIQPLPASGSSNHQNNLTSATANTATIIASNAVGTTVNKQANTSAAFQTSPTKTVTITSQGILSPVKTVIATVPGTGTKVSLPIQKIPISPAKTPTKITMIPTTKSPLKQSVNPNITVLSRALNSLSQTGSVAINPGGSPSKVIIKQGPAPTTAITLKAQGLPTLAPQAGKSLQVVQSVRTPQIAQNIRPIAVSATGGTSIQTIPVSGNKFHYVRLVSPASNQNQATSVAIPKSTVPVVGQALPSSSTSKPVTIVAVTDASSLSQTNQVKVTLPVQQTTNLAPKPISISSANASVPLSLILPAGATTSTTTTAASSQNSSSSQSNTVVTTLAPIQPAPAPNPLRQLPLGTTILTAGNNQNLQNLQGFALVPASYVTQLQQQFTKPVQTQVPTPQPVPKQTRDYIPIASIDPAITQYTVNRNIPSQNGPTLEATGARPRKPCNCTKSQCLKLYCDCFANGEFCQNCNCTNCANNLEHEEERSKAIKSCLDRNPQAFHPKIGKGKDVEGNRRHNKGCNCKRSGCLKNYCECYEAKIMCSNFCKCIGCKNFEESPERKTLMHLADAAEVRVQQQTAAKTKLSSQISSVPTRPPNSSASGERLPFSFITADVAEATSACLLAQAEEAERMRMPPVVQERMIIEEFGRCLMQIIESANRTRAASSLA